MEEAAMKASAPIHELLNKAFERLKAQNRMLSLRGKAAQMGISPSYLSKLLRGEKKIPLSLIPSLKKHLHLDVAEVHDLQRWVLQQLEAEKATPHTGIRSSTSQKLNFQNYRDLTKSDFYLLEKWYHIPLLNLVTLPDFRYDVSWISSRLGVNSRDLNTSVKELIRRGYLNLRDGQLSVTSMKARFPTDKSHESIRRHHKNMIKKSVDVLETKTRPEDFDQRLINGISFSGDSRKIKEAQVILNEALYTVAELMAQGDVDEVFQINLQFFKVTNDSNHSKE